MTAAELREWLEECRRMTDAELERALPSASAAPAGLHGAMRHAVFSGGKRLRPAVCIAAARWAGAPPESAPRPAAALELLHTYTLVHDDLPCMDDDALRRGRPTAHIVFGEATALLAGDALLTLAFEWLAGGAAAGPLVAELACAAGSRGVVGGQADDLENEGRDPDWSVAASIHARKTAALFRAAAVMGAIIADAPDARRRALSDYGHALGMAFQIADDLLNVTATAAELGKPVGRDRERGKLTAVAALGETEARAAAWRYAETAMAALTPFGGGRGFEILRALARFSVERGN